MHVIPSQALVRRKASSAIASANPVGSTLGNVANSTPLNRLAKFSHARQVELLLQYCLMFVRCTMSEKESGAVTQEFSNDNAKYYERDRTQYPETKTITFFVVCSWLLAMTLGMAFWTLLFHITPTAARLIHRW